MNSQSSPWVLCISRLLLLITLFGLSIGSALGQSAGADYTSDLPSVERVKTEIKGTDAGDTFARQAAIFTYLLTYVQRIKEARSYSGPYTPGEIRARNAYSLAAYQIEQDYKKSHSPGEVAAWSNLEGRYEINNALNWIHQLSGPQANAAYSHSESVFQASAKRMYNRQMQENQEATQRAQAANGAGGSHYMGNDAGSVAIRRCLELGGGQLQCLGHGLSIGSLDLLGMGDSPLLKGPSHTGLALAGNFKSGSGIAAQFSDTGVSLSNCGKLLIDAHAYTMQRSGSQILIHVKNSPSPFTFVLGLDGKLQGPASAEIAGKVITGYRQVWVPNPPSHGYYQTQTTTSHQELTPLEAGQYAGQSGLTQNGQTYDMATTSTQSTYVPGSGGGGHYESVPIYAPKTQACSIGTLTPGPPTEVDPGMLTDLASVTGALFGGSSSHTGSGAQEMLAPGVRVAGTYISRGGLKADFADASVIFDCGEAHVRDKYTVERTGARILIHVQNSASPLTLEVEPDGSLAGPASVSIAGRLVSGMNGTDVTFTPHSETCGLGAFTPGESASRSASNTGGPAEQPHAAAPATVAATSPPRALPGPPTSQTSATSVRAAFRVLIHAEFSGGTNPLAGQHVMVMQEPMDEVLRKLGVPVTAGATPGQAMHALAEACRTRDCRPIYAGLVKYFVTVTTLDSTGKAILSATAHTGRYFFFASAPTAGGTFMWDIPANLVAGDNNVTLSAANAEKLAP